MLRMERRRHVAIYPCSYVDWQASPIATSISTHPISELDFPTVTVCPPEGSNTALNYDLARARNITLTKRDRESLINATRNILIDQPSQDFVHIARSLLSEENILEIFERKPMFSYPMAYNDPELQNVKSYMDQNFQTGFYP